MSREESIAKIVEILSTQSWWIINQVYRATVNITKDEKGGVVK